MSWVSQLTQCCNVMIIVYAMCMFLNRWILLEWTHVSKLRHTFIVIKHDISIFISFDFELTFVRENTMINLSFMKQIAVVVNLSNEKNRISRNIQKTKMYEVIELTSKFIVSKSSILKCFNITLLLSQYDYYSFMFFEINSFEDRMFIFRFLDRNLRCKMWMLWHWHTDIIN